MHAQRGTVPPVLHYPFAVLTLDVGLSGAVAQLREWYAAEDRPGVHVRVVPVPDSEVRGRFEAVAAAHVLCTRGAPGPLPR
eukprot:1823931-Rhodomonas_salina.2